MKKLKKSDGFEIWRDLSWKKINNLVEQRLTFLQNPKICNETNSMFVNRFENENCGFLCQLETMTKWMILGYGTEKTLVLNNEISDSFEGFFSPMSDTCSSMKNGTQPSSFLQPIFNNFFNFDIF